MKILQITKKFPWPIKDGEVMAIINLTTGFAQLGHEVTVLSLNTKKHYFPLNQLPENIVKLAKFKAVDIDTKIEPRKAFFNLFTNQSYNVERFYSVEFENKIEEVLKQENFDLILLEGIYLMRYIDVIRKTTKAKVLLRPHNVEYIIWERLAAEEKNPLIKMYLNLLAKRMKKFELDNINKPDMLAPVSETDMKLFVEQDSTLPYKTIPIGYIFDTLPTINTNEETAVAFIGGMDWLPNREGVEWFINAVWPRVIDKIPNAKFYLAGRNFPDDIKKLKATGLNIVGEVANAHDFIFSRSILIVPLFAGSGMRVKIIEAMALGRAIVSTSVGAESIAYTDGKDILIEDNAENFAGSIVKLLVDKELRMELGKNAQQLVLDKYDNRKLSAQLIEFCKPHLN